jgi:hypothetical protein
VGRSNKAEAHPKPQTSRAKPAQSRAADLDRLIHEPIRLGIVSALAINETMTFNELKGLLKTTDGNLSASSKKGSMLRAKSISKGACREPSTA